MAENQIEETQVLQRRTKQFAVRVVRLFRALPKSEDARVMGRQLLRSATSVAANYRATGRARSKAEFASKMGIVVEEADESMFWIELLVETDLIAAERVAELLDEAQQLVRIFAASHRTAKKRRV